MPFTGTRILYPLSCLLIVASCPLVPHMAFNPSKSMARYEVEFSLLGVYSDAIPLEGVDLIHRNGHLLLFGQDPILRIGFDGLHRSGSHH